MPWPMRFGPLPRMTTFVARVRVRPRRSARSVLYMYGVNDSNSAAHVSMRL